MNERAFYTWVLGQRLRLFGVEGGIDYERVQYFKSNYKTANVYIRERMLQWGSNDLRVDSTLTNCLS